MKRGEGSLAPPAAAGRSGLGRVGVFSSQELSGQSFFPAEKKIWLGVTLWIPEGCPFAVHSCVRAAFLGSCLTFPGKGGNKSPSLVADC